MFYGRYVVVSGHEGMCHFTLNGIEFTTLEE
jgi:hypothetical protein